MQAKDRMTINTLVMYSRYIISMGLTLFSSRWILLALGEEDFGIYSLVAGLLSLLMFLNVTLASSTQRFMSFAQGKGDEGLLKDTFFLSAVLHLFLGFIIIILIESIGIWMLDNVLKVPFGKLDDAKFVLHTLSISTFVTIISVPYNAALISHENIIYVTIVQLLETISKFIAAFYLLYYSGNRLRLYAIIMMVIPIVSALLYRFYCIKHYPESKLTRTNRFNKSLLKELASYSGWNLIGGASSLVRTQGVSMLMNTFFGVIVNAAYGLATQIQGQLQYFTFAILTATRPQIVKSEGMGNRKRMHALTNMACKASFLLLTLLAIPVIIEMPYILRIWLKEVPQYTIAFAQIVIVTNMLTQLTLAVQIGIEAVGKIKMLQLTVGMMHFFVLPVGYVLLKMGCQPEIVLVVVLIEEFLGTIMRLVVSHRVTGLNVSLFIRSVIAPCVLVAIINYTVIYMWAISNTESIMRLGVSCLLSLIFVIPSSYFLCLNSEEKKGVLSILNNAINKIRRN